MLKSSGFKEKLYTNDKALCVVGDGIDLVRQHRPPRCYTNRNIQLSVEAPEEASPRSREKKAASSDKRKTFKLNVKEFQNFQVCSKQLRQIYETVEVGDFERILRSLYVSDEYSRKREKSRTNDIIAGVRPDEVYEHFFGQHYSYLKNLINKS